MDYRLALMTGVDIPLPAIQTSVHQPTLEEVSYIGEREFFLGIQTLCLNKSLYIKDENLSQTTTNFQVFMMVIHDSHNIELKQATQSLLTLLFPVYKIGITPQSIILMNQEQGNKIIDETNFEEIQEVFRDILCVKSNLSGAHTTFNPQGKKAQEIAEKLMRGRQRVAAQKGDLNDSMLSRYLSILAIGLQSTSLQDLIKLTLFQIYDLLERYHLYTDWDITIRARLAGASGEHKPEDWMKNIH